MYTLFETEFTIYCVQAFAREAAAARASNETQVTSGRGDDRDLRGEGADLGLFGRLMPGMLGSRRPGRQASSSGIPQVLLDLGIPPHVCLRAMHESGNDGKASRHCVMVPFDYFYVYSPASNWVVTCPW